MYTLKESDGFWRKKQRIINVWTFRTWMQKMIWFNDFEQCPAVNDNISVVRCYK